MPRAIESLEVRILRYFRQAPLAAAQMLLGLVKAALHERQAAHPGRPAGKARRKRAPKPAPAPAPAPAPKKSHHKQAAAAPPKAKKRHKRPRPLPGSETPEVEVFGEPL